MLDDERDEDSPLGVRVYAAACTPLGKGGHEEGSAGGGLKDLPLAVSRRLSMHRKGVATCAYLWTAQVLFALVIHDKNVRWLHELFLHARRGNVDVASSLDGEATACTRDPTMRIKLAAELADVVRWMQRIRRGYEGIVVVTTIGRGIVEIDIMIVASHVACLVSVA